MVEFTDLQEDEGDVLDGNEPRVASLVVSAGGYGGAALLHLHRGARHSHIEGLHLVGVDMDRRDAGRLRRAGVPTILLDPSGSVKRLGADRMESIRRWTWRFDGADEVFSRFAAHHGPQALGKLNLVAGAGTRPPFGDIIARACLWQLCHRLRDVLQRALAEADLLQVYVVGSGGGGTSAPLMLILVQLLGTEEGLALCTYESPHRVLAPIVVSMPPYLQAIRAENQVYASRPLANALKFQDALDELSAVGAVQYALKLGLQNGSSVAFNVIDAGARAMADVLEGLIVSQSSRASSLINTTDQARSEGRNGLLI